MTASGDPVLGSATTLVYPTVRSRRVNFQQSVGHPRIVTICSSVNRVFFMAPPGLEDAILSSVSWSENRQAGQVVMINVPEQEQCQTTI